MPGSAATAPAGRVGAQEERLDLRHVFDLGRVDALVGRVDEAAGFLHAHEDDLGARVGLGEDVAIGETGGTFVAAAVLAAVATRLTLRPDQPPRLVLLLPGFFTLTVGSLGMQGLTTLAGGYVIEGFHDLLTFVTIVTAIAVGLVFGATLAQPAGAGR